MVTTSTVSLAQWTRAPGFSRLGAKTPQAGRGWSVWASRLGQGHPQDGRAVNSLSREIRIGASSPHSSTGDPDQI
jgi:hypothetical protein